jgi:hypothetical protein
MDEQNPETTADEVEEKKVGPESRMKIRPASQPIEPNQVKIHIAEFSSDDHFS